MSEGVESVLFVTVVIQQKGEDNDESQPMHVEVDPSKFRFLLPQLQDAVCSQQFVNTGEVIADLSEAVVGAELAADIAVMLDVSEGRTAVDSVRIAAQTLRGADYVQLPEELYLERVVSFFLEYLLRADSTTPSVTATPAEVVPCVHTGQLMWDRLGAYKVLRLEQMGIISLGHKGVIDARDRRIDDKLLALAATMNDVSSLDIWNDHITQCDAFAETLVTLVLQGCYIFPDASIQRVAKYGRLQHLNVGGAYDIGNVGRMNKISDASIMDVAQNCSMLQHLDVSNNVRAITDASISLVAQHCPQLQYLDVHSTRFITNTSISLVARHCPQLEYLDVNGTNGAITDASISLVAQHCPNLKHLNAGSTDGKITDISISLIAQHCPQLQHLSAMNNRGITDTSIALIAHHCPQLQHLDVASTEGAVTDTSIALIAQHCPKLQHLDVASTEGAVTDTSIVLIAQHCPQLRYLDVYWTRGAITDTSLSLFDRSTVKIRFPFLI